MQWIYSIKPKYKAALILAVVFVMVLGNNILSKRNVTDLGTSFSSVYEDRLLVESYIFKLTDLLYRKKILLDKTYSSEELAARQKNITAYNTEINDLLAAYEKTKLTETETGVFALLKNNILEMEALEKTMVSSENGHLQAKPAFDNSFNSASGNLGQLSQIQVNEGKLLNDESKKNIAGFTLHTQLEIGLLLLLGAIIQALVFTSRSILPKTTQKHSLN